MKIYTKTGDDGTTGLYFGGRTEKNGVRPTAYGHVDEAQAALGVARAYCAEAPIQELIAAVQRDLWVVMADLATVGENRAKLVPDVTAVSVEMVESLEHSIDVISDAVEMPREFVVPGESLASAALDFSRTVIRRAERSAVAVGDDSEVVKYLNRLSDWAFTLARYVDRHHRPVRSVRSLAELTKEWRP